MVVLTVHQNIEQTKFCIIGLVCFSDYMVDKYTTKTNEQTKNLCFGNWSFFICKIQIIILPTFRTIFKGMQPVQSLRTLWVSGSMLSSHCLEMLKNFICEFLCVHVFSSSVVQWNMSQGLGALAWMVLPTQTDSCSSTFLPPSSNCCSLLPPHEESWHGVVSACEGLQSLPEPIPMFDRLTKRLRKKGKSFHSSFRTRNSHFYLALDPTNNVNGPASSISSLWELRDLIHVSIENFIWYKVSPH